MKKKDIIGIVAAKENSNRFPGKNYYKYKGKPLFAHGIELLQDCGFNIMMATNSEYIREYCVKRLGVPVMWRQTNMIYDEQPYFDVIRWVYQGLSKPSRWVISILSNSVGHEKKDIKKMINLLKNSPDEVRSYGQDGRFNGVVIYDSELFNNYKYDRSVNICLTKGREIHYKEEL
ncbi:MAG: hypothetical protein MIO92_16895 [Methanosarcinaceae archaeon]|nr:hypothetical protein [Methanosarcinaceae archaeon]